MTCASLLAASCRSSAPAQAVGYTLDHKCGFVFAAQKLLKPGKCPQCRSTWLEEPVIEIIDA